MMDEPVITDHSTPNQEVLISNSCGLSARIFNLLFSKEMSDVCLQVGDCSFQLHKLILSASSDVFKAMLTNQTWPEANRQPVVLVEEPHCESVFARFIEYIYSGELYLSHSSVCPLLTLADKYNVREMIPLCRTYMLDNLDAPMGESCVLQWLKNAQLRNDSELEAAVMDFIECNFSLVMQTPDFMTADLDIVDKLLSSSRLAVHNETMLLYATMMWLETFVDDSYLSDESIRDAFHKILRHVRWKMLTSDETTCLQGCPVVRQFFKKYKQYCLPLQFPLGIFQHYCCEEDDEFLPRTSLYYRSAAAYTDMQEARLSSNVGKPDSTAAEVCKYKDHKSHCRIQSKPPEDKSLPRIYINDYWCTALTISNFHAFPQYGTQTFLFSTPGMSDNYSFSGHTLEWEVSFNCIHFAFHPCLDYKLYLF